MHIYGEISLNIQNVRIRNMSAKVVEKIKTHILRSLTIYENPTVCETMWQNTGLSKKTDGIWNRYNLKSTGRIYTFGILKCSEKFKVLDLP